MQRPIGVRIVAVVIVIEGLFLMITQSLQAFGLAALPADIHLEKIRMAASLGGVFIAAPLLIVSGVGIWKMRQWGIVIGFFAIGICLSYASLIGTVIVTVQSLNAIIPRGELSYLTAQFLLAQFLISGIASMLYLWQMRDIFT